MSRAVDVSSQRFVLTGCASGIGRHLAVTLAARGARLLATDVRLEPLQALAREHAWAPERVRLRRLDVREPDEWAAAIAEATEAFGGVDVLMNVAGYLAPGWLLETSAEAVHRQIDINLKGVLFGTQAAARAMIAQGRGHVVNVASMAALAPVPGLAVYCASKYAVRGLSLAAAQELRPHGVAVTVVCPDAVQTPMLDLQKGRDEAALTFSGPRPLTVDEVAGVVLGRVLRGRPLEAYIHRRRGWMARFADLFPATTFVLGPLLRRVGRARQKKILATER